MDRQLEEPLKDTVYIVALEMDCDGYDTIVRVYATKELAIQGLADWYSEEWNYWLDRDCPEEDLDNESYLKDDNAYLTDCDSFWYTWTMHEEEVRYE